MHRKAITGAALVILLAIGGTSVGTASATRLTLSEGGTALVPGEAFEIYGRDDFSVTTSEGAVYDCASESQRTGLEVSVVTNSKATDELTVDHVEGGDLGNCRSFTGNVGLTLQEVGGPLDVRSSGKATAGGVGISLFFEHIRSGEREYEINCDYTRSGLKGTNTATTAKQALELGFAATMKLDVSASGTNAKRICPKAAEMELGLPSSESFVEDFGPIEEQTL